MVHAVRNQIDLAGELRNPEAVVGVGRQQRQEGRSESQRIAHRNVQLVGRDDTERRVAVLPPELVPHHRDFDGCGGLRCVLNRVNHASRRGEEDEDDQDRHDRPGQFDLGAAVHLCGFMSCDRPRWRDLQDHKDEQTRDHDEDHRRDAQHEHRQIDDRAGRRGRGSEYVEKLLRLHGRAVCCVMFEQLAGQHTLGADGATRCFCGHKHKARARRLPRACVETCTRDCGDTARMPSGSRAPSTSPHVIWTGPCLRAVAFVGRMLEMATGSIVAAPRPESEPRISLLKTTWRRFGTPLLVVLMALAIALTITRNWNAWEGGRIEQVTNDAYVKRDLTPLSTKVVALVREVKVSDYQQVRKGDELVLLADDDYRAQVSQAIAAVDAAKAALENNRRQRDLQDARTERALAGIDQAQAQIAAAQAGKEAVQADVSRTNAERIRQEALVASGAATRQRVEAAVADAERFSAQ